MSQDQRRSDPDLLDAFRKQCRTFGAGQALLAWQDQPGVDPDDLMDIFKEEDRRAADEYRPPEEDVSA